ncbi:hypothetical protein ACLD0W_14890 [Alloalcanivorax sp. C16-1]|uniref:hypothetical protein n=1 Tax=Alloalcanivorax sp. C16-1 TaxID=3390051 RepID=UPI0039707E27
MKNLEFVALDRVEPEALLSLMNQEPLRRHLVDHACFDSASIRGWVQEKLAVDVLPGCDLKSRNI